MPADRVIIEELFLRLPGLTAEEARAVSRDVTERLGRGLEGALPARSLGALDVKLEVRAGASREEIVDSVVRGILGALAR